MFGGTPSRIDLNTLTKGQQCFVSICQKSVMEIRPSIADCEAFLCDASISTPSGCAAVPVCGGHDGSGESGAKLVPEYWTPLFVATFCRDIETA
jgi:hypothetical protein